ncbi:MAG: mechanosensitive ion channel family protein [Candidatus Dadabacteria bacterium]|nr:mechanosensitive ion channel family protein [Candidatus Dadabacteria bacterium]MDE0663541.1 mechanosensitive ion channel family protein [Candidatus Dadabacteria bacterium]
MNIEEIFSRTYLGNPTESWLWALGAAIVLALVFNFILKRFVRGFANLAEKTETDLDDLVSTLLGKTSIVLIIIFSVYVATFFLDLTQQVREFRKSVVIICLLLQIGLWGGGFIDYYVAKKLSKIGSGSGASITHIRSLGFFAKSVLWIILVILTIDNLGFDPTTIIAGLGVGGIAVALALQNVLGDLIASLSIIFDKPFEVGDFIVVDDIRGDVEHIGLKTTRLRSLSGEQLVLSNNDLLQSRIKNYKRMDSRRINFSLGVIYETSYDNVERIPGLIKDIIESEEKARFVRAHFSSYGDFSLNYDIVYFVLSPLFDDYMDIQQRINLKIFKKFSDEGIEFAYPTRKIFLDSVETASTGAGAGD